MVGLLAISLLNDSGELLTAVILGFITIFYFEDFQMYSRVERTGYTLSYCVLTT